MKKTLMRMLLLAAIVLVASVLGSCALKPVSIADRIGDFVASINGDRSSTHSNFDPVTAGNATDATYWNIIFTASTGPYTYPAPNTSNPASVLVDITGATGPVYHFKFIMHNIGSVSDNWVIEHLELPVGSQIL